MLNCKARLGPGCLYPHMMFIHILPGVRLTMMHGTKAFLIRFWFGNRNTILASSQGFNI